MKKFLSVILALCMMLSLVPMSAAAADLSGAQPQAAAVETVEEPAAAEPAEEPVEEPVEEPAEEPIEEPAAEPAGETAEESAAEPAEDELPGNWDTLRWNVYNGKRSGGYGRESLRPYYTVPTALQSMSVSVNGHSSPFSERGSSTGWTVADAKAGDIVITPPAGWRVVEVLITCNDGAGFNCNTQEAGNVASLGVMDAGTGRFIIDNQSYLTAYGNLNRSYWHDGRGDPYYIMIHLEEYDSFYVEYDPGTVGTTAIVEGQYGLTDLIAATASTPNYAGNDVFHYETENPDHSVLAPADTEIEVGGKKYSFGGWRLEWYNWVSLSGGAFAGMAGAPTAGGVKQSGDVINPDPQHAKLTAIWTLVEEHGALKISKEFSGLDDSLIPGDLSFTVTGPGGYSNTVSFSDFRTDAQGSRYIILRNLTPGEYTVTENNGAVEGYDLSLSYNTPAAGTVTVEPHSDAGETTDLTIVNTYTRDTGSLTITKVLAGDPVTLPRDLSFTVTGPEDYSETVYYTDFENGSYTLSDLPTGEYTVEESDAGVPAFSVQTSYSNGGTAAVTKDQTATVTVTNTYTQVLGDLTVIKEFAGDIEEADWPEETFVIHLWESLEPSAIPISLSPETAVKTDKGWQWTVESLPFGSYVLEERGFDVAHLNLESATIGGEAAESVSEIYGSFSFSRENSSVTVVNTYGDEPQHMLDIPFEKLVTVAEGSPLAGSCRFDFVLDLPGDWTADGSLNGQGGRWVSYLEDLFTVPGEPLENFHVMLDADELGPDGTATVSGTIRLVGSTTDFERLIEQIEDNNGDRISITETAGSAPGWSYDDTVWEIGFEMENEGTEAQPDWHPVYTLYRDGTEVTDDAIAFENSYQWDCGSLNISKEVEGRDNDSSDYSFELTVTRPAGSTERVFAQILTDGVWQTKVSDGDSYTYSFTLSHGETLQARIPAGWSYEVEEILPEEADYEAAYSEENSGVIGSGETAELTVTNRYWMTADVLKLWNTEDEEAPAEVKRVEVQLYWLGPDGIPEPYGDPVDLTAEDEWYHVWDRLPYGRYTVEEAAVYGALNKDLSGEFQTEVEDVTEDVFDIVGHDFSFDITNTPKMELTASFTKTVEQKGDVKPGSNEFLFALEPWFEEGRDGSVEYIVDGETLVYDELNGCYYITAKVKNAGSVTVDIVIRGFPKDVYMSDFVLRETLPATLGEEWSYDDTEYMAMLSWDWEENEGYVGLPFLEYAKGDPLSYEVEMVEEVVFVNTHTLNRTDPPPAPEVPGTGDNSRPILWALLAVLAAGGLGLTAVLRRRRIRG